jgi:peptide/nickel transport system permease protein
MMFVLKELWQRRSTRFCLLVTLVFALAAAWGEVSWLRHGGKGANAPFNLVRMEQRNLPPAFESGRLLGTDNLGRDVAARLAQGTRIAFRIGVSTSLLSLALGTILGLVAGYFGRAADAVVQSLCTVFSAIPSILLIIALTLLLGKGLLALFVALSLTTWVSTCRQVRAETLRQRHLPYVLAARTLGFSPARILSRHIFPNTAHLLLVGFSTRFPVAVSTEVLVSFLGIGATQEEPSWGILLSNARSGLWRGCWWELAFVSLALFLLLLAFNHLADTLRDVLDPTVKASV